MFESASAVAPRMLVLRVPDWPVLAHVRGASAAARGRSASGAVAIIEKGLVHACSAAAREAGVRRGLRVREAQARCPRLTVIPHDPALDARAFEPVLAALETALPGVHPVRPGTVAVRSRGPARYYGGERAAALGLIGVIAEALGAEATGASVGQAGVADGLFAAGLAAVAADPVLVVPPGRAAEFLADHPVTVLEDPDLASLLPRLGIRTLGGFAALAQGDVAARFGPEGARLHALAGGRDPRTAVPRLPPRDVEVQVDFEPPLEHVEQIAFGVRRPAEAFVAELLDHSSVATAIRVELIGDRGEASERVWLHPRSFAAAEIVDRVRWQLQGAVRPPGAGGSRDAGPDARDGHRRWRRGEGQKWPSPSAPAREGGELRSPVTRVRITPEAVDPIGRHETGLWGTGPDERVHSGLARVQGLLGHRGVLTAEPSGGRMPGDRQTRTAWGDRPLVARDPARPWPGAIPRPAPATVYELPREVAVRDRRGADVGVSERGVLSASPAVIVAPTGARREITSWAGPWPLEERWWDPEHARRANRFQAVDETGDAWLLVLDDGGWWAEAHYD